MVCGSIEDDHSNNSNEWERKCNLIWLCMIDYCEITHTNAIAAIQVFNWRMCGPPINTERENDQSIDRSIDFDWLRKSNRSIDDQQDMAMRNTCLSSHTLRHNITSPFVNHQAICVPSANRMKYTSLETKLAALEWSHQVTHYRIKAKRIDMVNECFFLFLVKSKLSSV